MASTSSATAASERLTAAAATVTDAQQWAGTLRRYSLRLEHVAVDISTDRILYHLECELDEAIPAAYLQHCEFLSLGWPLGGIWKIFRLSEGNRVVHCLAWRKTELNHEHIEEMNDELLARQRVTVPDPPLAIFAWKMQLGKWKDRDHWFLRDALPPASLSSPSSTAVTTPPLDAPVHVRLLAGFASVEAYLNINSISAVDTVAQTFTADVTWELTFPGVTAIREDSVLRELLDLLEFNETAFEFANVTSIQDERGIATVLTFAGSCSFHDPLSTALSSTSMQQASSSLPAPSSEKLHDLTYSRRTIAVFSEEMSLYNFPYDQQKLTFAFTMGTAAGGSSSNDRTALRVVPAPITSGRFALENFKLGNVFDVVYGTNVFIGNVHSDTSDASATPTPQTITFELTLARRSGYYFTNVALPAAIITYLCFSTFAPVDSKTMELMDTSSRLQIVITLLLTAVTFKSQVASLLPQVSYFTSLDRYVFFCFVVTCGVTLENALFPSFVQLFPTWREDSLLVFSISVFTLVNIVWVVYIALYIRLRTHRSHVLLQVEAIVRTISANVPTRHRLAVLHAFLKQHPHTYPQWALPTIGTSIASGGGLFIQLPDDSPASEHKRTRHGGAQHRLDRIQTLCDAPTIQQLYHKLDPSASAAIATSCNDDRHDHRHHHANDARTGMAGVLARQSSSSASCFVVHMHDEAAVAPLRQSVTHYRRQSQA